MNREKTDDLTDKTRTKTTRQTMSRKTKTIAGQLTSGFADPKMDLFSDVKRALHAYLMRTDEKYIKASRDAKERNERRQVANSSCVHRREAV